MRAPILEGEFANVHNVPIGHSGTCEEAKDTEPFKALIDIGEGFRGGDIVQRDHPLNIAADDHVLAVVGVLDDCSGGLGSQHHHPVNGWFIGARCMHHRCQLPHKATHTIAGDRRNDGVNAIAVHRIVGHQISFCSDHDARTIKQLWAVLSQLAKENFFLLSRPDSVERSQVDHHTQHSGTLHVT